MSAETRRTAQRQLDEYHGPYLTAGNGRVWHRPSALGRPACWPQADPDNVSVHETADAAATEIEDNDDAQTGPGYPRACRECFPEEVER